MDTTTTRYQVTYPSTPGATPTVRHRCATLREARQHARAASRERSDLRGQDVRIEDSDGRLVEYAGIGA